MVSTFPYIVLTQTLNITPIRPQDNGSIAFGVPLFIYVWRRGNTTNPNSNSVGEHRGANQEYTQNAEGNQSGNQSGNRQHSEPNLSVHDEVRYPPCIHKCLYLLIVGANTSRDLMIQAV